MRDHFRTYMAHFQKKHFQDELRKLKEVLGPSMRGSSYHTANLISEEVKREIHDIKHEVLNVEGKILQAVATNTAIIQDLMTQEKYYQDCEQPEMINNTTQTNINSKIFKMIQLLQSDLNHVKSQLRNEQEPN